MPITAIALLRLWDMGVLRVFGAPCQIRYWRDRSTAGPSHYLTTFTSKWPPVLGMGLADN